MLKDKDIKREPLEQSRCVTILLAGGLGTRFSASSPKQLAMVSNKSILIHTLERLTSNPRIAHIVVVANPKWEAEIKADLSSVNTSIPLTVVSGGASRNESVRNGLFALPSEQNADLVLVHDGVRPIFSSGLVDRVLDKLEHADAVVPVIPSSDPLFHISRGRVERVVSRESVYRGQSPQGFRRDVLESAMRSTNEIDTFTTLYELVLQGDPISKIETVEGEFENIKVTQPIDRQIVETILSKPGYEAMNLLEVAVTQG